MMFFSYSFSFQLLISPLLFISSELRNWLVAGLDSFFFFLFTCWASQKLKNPLPVFDYCCHIAVTLFSVHSCH